jgi:nitrite reductase/ring-hydroxylating ferredoxin subunit
MGSDQEGWQFAASISQLPPDEPIVARVGEHVLAIGRNGSTYFAVDNTCPHAGGSLGNGILKEGNIVCPLHNWEFDVTTGKCGRLRICTYPVRVHKGNLEVQIT